MKLRSIQRPDPSEYPAYAEIYMSLLPDDGRILDHLIDNFHAVKRMAYDLPSDKLTYRYAPGKWSINEILVHLIDDERIYAYRALRFARNEQQGLIGFDQNEYVMYSHADSRDLDNIFEEYEAVRNSTVALFNGLPDEALTRMGRGVGTANDASVRALAYHIAGHELRHLNIIKERYL
jgi:hypothetical protein